MKNNGSTEIDQLMRRLARRSGDAARSEGQRSETIDSIGGVAHLDADEMNAYAEGALPESSRARYFAHLADCDSCRKLVTDLSLATARAEVTTVPVTKTVPASRKSWRDWLSTIFSPPVLRFAVPAVALFAIIVVAIVATRTRKTESMVAQKEESGRAFSPSVAANSNSTAHSEATQVEERNRASNSAVPSVAPSQTPLATSTVPPAMKTARTEEDSPAVGPGTIASPARPVDRAGQEGNTFGDVAQRAEREVTMGSPPPKPAETSASADTTIRDKQADEKKAKVAGKDDDVIISERTVGGAVSSESRTEAARKLAGRRGAPQAQGLPMSRPAPAAKNEPVLSSPRENSSEQRSLGGRKFRRNGGAWVDTAYTSSLQTTHVARGSEQFRALVADEPGLRAITQQLAGEVFVVWKSRAYRFY